MVGSDDAKLLRSAMNALQQRKIGRDQGARRSKYFTGTPKWTRLKLSHRLQTPSRSDLERRLEGETSIRSMLFSESKLMMAGTSSRIGSTKKFWGGEPT